MNKKLEGYRKALKHRIARAIHHSRYFGEAGDYRSAALWSARADAFRNALALTEILE